LLALCFEAPVNASDLNEQLWEASRKGDAKAVHGLIAQGADVNAKTHYGANALWLAASKGHADVVKILLKHKADPNNIDIVWGGTPMAWSVGAGKVDMVHMLLEAGADPDASLMDALSSEDPKMIRAVLASAKVKAETLGAALFFAPKSRTESTKALAEVGAKPLPAASAKELKEWKAYEGDYETHNGMKLTVTIRDGQMTTKSGYGDQFVLKPTGADVFRAIGYKHISILFDRDSGQVIRATRRRAGYELPFERPASRKSADTAPATTAEDTDVVASARPWPSFRGLEASGVADGQHPPIHWEVKTGRNVRWKTRGLEASGVADGQHPPIHWEVKTGRNVRWKTPIPGLAHSSPVGWGQRLFVTTAVSSDPKSEFKAGNLGGSGASAQDVSRHSWRVYCLDKSDGKIVWEKTASEGVPRFKRHVKASHANCTPATDGKHLVAYFASEGLYCYDYDGNLLWKQSLGAVDAGAFSDPDIQWGAASSPIIHNDRVFIQCDRSKDSFIAAYDLGTGQQFWSTPRDELPGWATPTIVEGPTRVELVTNGTKYARGYDPLTGKELWRLGPNSEITVPTPIAAQGLIFITSGYHPIQPIHAVHPGASGDISPKAGGSVGAYVEWTKNRGGPYQPTPIAYGACLYACANSGMLACFEARTGKLLYKNRLGGNYSASPVAADGRIYFPSEEGDIRVVQAGPAYQALAVNKMDDACMATPAISDGMMFVRTQHFVYGIGRTEGTKPTAGGGAR
jgi:outer membrane protein assembly factor BamB